MPDAELKELRSRMEKVIEHLKKELQGVRTGRAHPALVEDIKVEYYGTQTPISQLATISIPDARQILISPWDKTAIKTVEKAIQASQLGINPQVDGDNIRLVIPELTGERRVELSKLVRKYAEEARVAVRNIRREGNDIYKKMEKNGDISEDQMHDYIDDVQELTHEFIKKIDEISEMKEKEILED
ncbi:MAG TPA: ribosome recycling factor [Synergistaceae bacterium]|jgi:ribosome recycling factor|nr:MAG: Ribosome-recycling factor [Synergistales bacterium 53_16]KUL00223.1 MAG: Ribosome-recycling factor [Synergistales bacterium 54_9]MDK2845458.1 ribosome recycling factor [Synergistales bacterium]HAA47246.1 ribosome recycling factor [Synergistaceae bacterium]MDN5336545.1 ribosome recycling factor [Synergistales bacterium]